jgi:glutamate carboxypeptidase
LRNLNRKPQRPVTLLLTCDEETGSHFSRELVEQEGRKSVAALVLEPPIPGGRAKTSRKGVGDFQMIIRGRSSHAGNDPKSGASAITELAYQILAINKLADLEQGTTVNVGVVRGGILANVVAGETRASIDMRFKTLEEGLRMEREMATLSPVVPGCSIEVSGGINRPPLVRSEAIGELFNQAKLIAAQLGFELGEGSVGGGSDGNFIAAVGTPVLDGLGIDGLGAHSEHEHILIKDIPRRAALLTRLIETL